MNPAAQTMEKTTQGMMQMSEDMNAFMSAAMKSMDAMTKGCDETMRSTGNLMQETMAHAMNAGKSIMSAKDMSEMMNRHSEFVKECIDRCMAVGGRISEISARTAKEAIEPMAQQTNNCVSKMMQKARSA